MASLVIENHPELIDEDTIPLSAIGGELPFETNPGMVQRWMRQGVGGVVLETFVVGKFRFTSKQAVRRFINRINGKADNHQPAAPVKPSMPKRDLEAGRWKYFGGMQPGNNGRPAGKGE